MAQSCPTLCNTTDCSSTGSSVHGISQARILEWVAISYSRGIFTTQESNLGRRITPGFFTDGITREVQISSYRSLLKAEELMLLNCGVGGDS